VPPTQQITTVIEHAEDKGGATTDLEGGSLGSGPFFAKEIDTRAKMINARVESVAERPA
jgi:putative SOS response-associated peptidase YedK